MAKEIKCHRCGEVNLEKQYSRYNGYLCQAGRWVYYFCRNCGSDGYVRFVPGMRTK